MEAGGRRRGCSPACWPLPRGKRAEKPAGRVRSRGGMSIGVPCPSSGQAGGCPGPGAPRERGDAALPAGLAALPAAPSAGQSRLSFFLSAERRPGFVPERSPGPAAAPGGPCEGAEGVTGAKARVMRGSSDSGGGLLAGGERICRMIVMAAQGRLACCFNPLVRLKGPEPAPACVCVSRLGSPRVAPGQGLAGEEPGNVRRGGSLRLSPLPSPCLCPVTFTPAGRAGSSGAGLVRTC